MAVRDALGVVLALRAAEAVTEALAVLERVAARVKGLTIGRVSCSSAAALSGMSAGPSVST